MASGPEHFREAEKLLQPLAGGHPPYAATIALAQVHATLALAAATADPYGNEEHWKAVLT